MEQPELPREAMDALDEIDRILHQMLVLAELSAGEGNVNRTNLQTVLEYLQNKINRAADRLREYKNSPDLWSGLSAGAYSTGLSSSSASSSVSSMA